MIDAAGKPETNKTHTPHPLPKERPRTMALLPQDPTVCQTLPGADIPAAFQNPLPEGRNPYLLPARAARHLFVDIPPVSTRRRTNV
ncbi:hypothetical protein ABIB14_003765, partial [Arthrobacter sp. UYEF3]